MNESRETSGVVFDRDLWKRVIPEVEADSKCKGQPKPDAWIDHDKTKIGYEIPFNRHFYVFKPPRELAEIDTELKGVTDRIVKMIGELSQ